MIGGADRLREYLVEVFDRDYQPGPVHELLADVDAPMLIVTTNYDDLIERAFAARGKPFHVVQWTDDPENAGSVLWWPPGASEPKPKQPNALPLIPGKKDEKTIIYKMHGTVNRRYKMHGTVGRRCDRYNSFLITEEDYIEFLAGMTRRGAIPATFKNYFQEFELLVSRLRAGRLESSGAVVQRQVTTGISRRPIARPRHDRREKPAPLMGRAAPAEPAEVGTLAEPQRRHLRC